MIRFLLLVAGLALETSVANSFWSGQEDGWELVLILVMHVAGSLLLALFAWTCLPEKYRRPRWQITLLMFNFAFFIPWAGLLGVLAAILISGYKRRSVVIEPISKLVLPEFVLTLHEPEGKFSQGGIKSRLAESAIPVPQRLQSLLALQGMSARISSPLLQDMLGDSSDDIRLVAYGMLDGREKKITAQIHHELGNLKNGASKELRLICLRRLAELYWELVYAGLALGDLRIHALKQAISYVDSALELAGQDAGMLLLKGRILLELKQYEEAYKILELAVAGGLPESRVLPYMVEIAFVQRDYQSVRSLLARISDSQVTSVMKGALQFWKTKAGTVEDGQVQGNGA